jgi:transposase InsO family protein
MKPLPLPWASFSAPWAGTPTTAYRSERALSDNGACFRSGLWKQICTELGIRPRYTVRYWPQINGKICEDSRDAASDGLTLAKV